LGQQGMVRNGSVLTHRGFLKEMKAVMEKLKNKTGSFKVLIVDDSTTFRELLKWTLNDRFSSIEIYEAADGEEALQKIESLHPNLIFMDLGLPGENGLELTKQVKGRYPNIIIIILTGYRLPEYRKSSSRNADYVFLKDSSMIENILTLVESILPTRA
jgi:CheY-like chemotaxis protein